MKRWNKKKFINNIKELVLGTAYFTIPIAGIIFYGIVCNIFNL